MQEDDELMFNYFFHLLKTQYRKKFLTALSNCWTICVPIGTSMRGCPITKYFIEQHILKPTDQPGYFLSISKREPYLYRIEKRLIRFLKVVDPDNLVLPTNDQESSTSEEETAEDMMKYNLAPNSDNNLVRILSVEKGYNNQYQSYKLLILDNPLLPFYKDVPKDESLVTAVVDGFKNASEFLEILSRNKTFNVAEAQNLVVYLRARYYENVQAMQNVIKSFIQSNWAEIIRKYVFDYQRDARFQKRVSLALEIYVLHGLHKLIYEKMSGDFKDHNSYLKRKIDALNAVGATPDQLGVRKGFAIMLAHGVVELARLSDTTGPHERLTCLKSSLDMAIAEIKGAVAESVSKNDIDNELTTNITIMPADLIQICTYLIVKCKCYTLYQDLYYIENFVFSLNPVDKTGYIVTIYKSALENLEKIHANNLPPRSEKVKTELGLEDLMTIVMKDEPRKLSPMDIHLRNITTMIKRSTIIDDDDNYFNEEN